MDMDLNAAVTFLTTHGRILERRRMQLLLGEGTAEDVLAALDAYRTADGGYGWGLEPDLRSTTSQPVAAMHALEVLAEARDTKSRGHPTARLAVRPHVPGRRRAVRTALLGHCRECGALGDRRFDGLVADDDRPTGGPGTPAGPLPSRCRRTPVARPGHPDCLDQIEQTTSPHAIELMFVLRFLDAVAERTPRARPLLERFSGYVTQDGPHPVTGGAEGEVLHLLDFTPYSDAPSRAVFPAMAVAADRDRLASQQRPDGGWEVTYASFSPAGALEWRGYTTVQSVTTLRNGRL